MFILLIFHLLIILIVCLYLLFRLLKWIFKKETRIKWASALVGVIILTTLINHLFFKNMEFIKSKVYPDLYLVKYPIKDKDSMHKVIEEMIFQKLNNQFEKSSKNIIASLPYRIRFYEYYTGTPFFVPFGEAGTAHFIENKEDPGGFSSEYIMDYNTYRIAEFNLEYCKNDTLNFVGKLSYYQDWDVIKADTIINQCIINKDAEPISDGN